MKKNPIGKYLLQNWYYYVFAFGSMALSVFLDMLAPLVTLHIVDDVLVGHKMELLWKYLAAFLLIGAAKALFQYIKEFLFDVSSVRVASQMRDNLFRHVQRLSVEYFDKNNTGELLARVRDDVDRIWDILGFAGMLILEGLICIMMAMVSMVKLDLPLTLVSVAILPFVAGIAIRLEKELDRVYDAISEENAVMNTVAQENLAGVRTVKSFAREPYEIKKFRKHNQKYCDLNMDQARVLMKYDPAISFLTKLMRVLVLLAGGYGVIHGRITLGVLTAFMEYTSKITWPIENVGWLGNCFASAIASNKKLNKILAEEPQIAEPENPVELSKLPGDLEFHHVDFSLHDTPILQDIDFTLKQGHTLGIMGMTGSGKTTIVNLLERFYDVTDGSICLDGHDIRTLPLRTRRYITLSPLHVLPSSSTIFRISTKPSSANAAWDFPAVRSSVFPSHAPWQNRLRSSYWMIPPQRSIWRPNTKSRAISPRKKMFPRSSLPTAFLRCRVPMRSCISITDASPSAARMRV